VVGLDALAEAATFIIRKTVIAILQQGFRDRFKNRDARDDFWLYEYGLDKKKARRSCETSRVIWDFPEGKRYRRLRNQVHYSLPTPAFPTIELLWTLPRFDATDKYASEFGHERLPPFSCWIGKGKSMRFDHHLLRRMKAFLIEFTAFVSLLLVLIKIIVTEVRHLFR
jgi:hypothetical protein